MPAVLFKDEYSSFIYAVAKKRREADLWSTIIVQVASNQNEVATPMDELAQVLEFEFHGHEILIFIHNRKRRVFLLVHNDAQSALGVIEKTIQQKFLNDRIKIGSGVPLEKSLESLCQQLDDCILPDDHPAMINLKRLSRPSNLFFILTADPVKGEEFNRMIKEYAQVMYMSSEKEFLSKYITYAPNAVFIDSYFLKKINELAPQLKNSHDPYAYIVGIGKNPEIQKLEEYVASGVDGYLVWPSHLSIVLKHLKRIPTFLLSQVPGQKLYFPD